MNNQNVTLSLQEIWDNIEKAGSMDAYIQAQMKQQGFLVDRRETADMSQRELQQYKKDLKKEAAEKRKLKKAAWLAYKENHIVHLGDTIYWSDYNDWDKWDIEKAEERVAENELPPLKDAKALAEALDWSITELRWFTFHREAATRIHYYPFRIPKRDGTQREIWAPLPKLKHAQSWILTHILERLMVHGACHGFMPGRSILTNAMEHTNAQHIIKMDLKDFFPTITFPRVKGLFRKAGYRENIATLLALICTESPRQKVEEGGKTFYIAMGPRCLPQGAPTSPAITNAICFSLDRRLEGLAAKQHYRYSRYADDLTFSLSSNAIESEQPEQQASEESLKSTQVSTVLYGVKSIVEDEGFKVNHKKTRILRNSGRQTVTGLVVNGEGLPRVSRAKKRNYRAAIHNYCRDRTLKAEESWHSLYGYAAYIYMSDPKLGRELMNKLNAG